MEAAASSISELVAALEQAKCVTLHACELTLSGAGAERVAIALASNTSVRTLRLNECGIDDKVGALLAEALEENRSLRILSLCRNRLGPEGATKLAAALKTNMSLTKLDLSKNPLGNEGVAQLSEGLRQSRALSCLDLQVAGIGDEGAKALASALCETKLRELHLRDNMIGDDGAQHLANALLQNSTLSLLDLSFNSNIRVVGVEKLTQAVEQSDTITVLEVHGHRRSREEIARLKTALNKNKRTQVLTLHFAAEGEMYKVSCIQMSGAEVLELLLEPETALWQVFASVAEALTQPADSIRLITMSGQEILSHSQETIRSLGNASPA